MLNQRNAYATYLLPPDFLLSATRNHYQLYLRRTDFTVRLALRHDIMEPITTDSLEYPVSKRRRTTTLVSKRQSMDAHKMCALAIAVDVDLFGHLARRSPGAVPMIQLAAATGVEAQSLDTIAQTLAADGWLVHVEANSFAANKVTHAMTDPDFQSLVAHCFEMGLPAVLATPRFLSNIDYKASQDSFLLAWQVSQATSLGFFDYILNQPGRQRPTS